MISSISSLEIINVVKSVAKFEGRVAKSAGRRQDLNIYLWIAGFVTDAAAVNPNHINRFLANDLIVFPIKGNPVFRNGSKSLPKNPPDCGILYNWVFDNFILAEELLPKALRSHETCVLVNNKFGRPPIIALNQHLIS